MTQEEKQLLLKDLCSRLPYGVKVNFRSKIEALHEAHIYQSVQTIVGESGILYDVDMPNVKPYLRPMSSMTEDERLELVFILNVSYTDVGKYGIKFMLEHGFLGYDEMSKLLDWLNSHHFDYRGLIKKGLALEAPEGMYK